MTETITSEKNKLEKIIGGFGVFDKVAYYMSIVAMGVFFIMTISTFVDVFARYVLRNAIVGMKEITQVLLFVMIGLCVSSTFSKGRHITITLAIDKLRPKARAVVDLASTIISMVFLGFLTYSSVTQTQLYLNSGLTLGAIMKFLMWPFMAVVTLGFLCSFLLSVKQLLVRINTGIKLGVKWFQWLIGLVFAFALLYIFYLTMLKRISLDKGSMCLAAVVFMFILMFMGVPVGFSLWIIGTVLCGGMRNATSAISQIATLNYSITTDYTWAVVGFFLLMGMLCYRARFGEDIFKCITTFLSRVRGGTCVVTIVASACLAAIVGDNNSVVSTMSAIAYPEMKKYKYDDELAMGTLAAGSCLGPLIPPSTGFITYSLLTLVSLGKLFASGILPGILMALFFCLTIFIVCKIDPKKAPKGRKYSAKEKIQTLPGALPIIILFVLVIGGTMAGVFTANEGGAIGCVGALVIGLILRRFKFKTIFEAFEDSGQMVGMIFTVIVGAKVLSSGFGWCNLSGIVNEFFASLNLSPRMTVAIILVIFFIAGFFIDILPLQFVGIPIVFGIITALGIDGVWFGCLLIIICNCGVITPPFATVLFVMKGLMPEVPLKTIFKGVIPFVIATVAVVLLLFFIPDIVMIIPNMLG